MEIVRGVLLPAVTEVEDSENVLPLGIVVNVAVPLAVTVFHLTPLRVTSIPSEHDIEQDFDPSALCGISNVFVYTVLVWFPFKVALNVKSYLVPFTVKLPYFVAVADIL